MKGKGRVTAATMVENARCVEYLEQIAHTLRHYGGKRLGISGDPVEVAMLLERMVQQIKRLPPCPYCGTTTRVHTGHGIVIP